MALINKIEAIAKGKFNYYLYRDPEITGRFEVTIFLDSEDDQGEGVLLHSKQESKKMVDSAQLIKDL